VRADVSANASKARRFFHGFILPFALLRALLRDAPGRRAYLGCVIVQAVLTLALGLAIATAGYRAIEELRREGGVTMEMAPNGLQIRASGDAPPNTPVEIEGLEEVPVALRSGVVYLYLVYGATSLVEWLVIALSRDFHDQIGRRAAELSGVPPEDPPLRPRVRVNLRWMWTKVKRRVRGLKVFAFGFPMFAAGSLIPSPWRLASGVVATAWGVYWLSVFVGAKSARAWRDEGSAPDPWFLRAYDALVAKSRLFRWWLPRWYGRAWRRHSAAVFPPCARFEESPYELLGLGALRVVCGLPLVYLFVRPVIPVAAAHLVTGPVIEDEPRPRPGSDRSGT
jgi:hypothetical protein